MLFCMMVRFRTGYLIRTCHLIRFEMTNTIQNNMLKLANTLSVTTIAVYLIIWKSTIELPRQYIQRSQSMPNFIMDNGLIFLYDVNHLCHTIDGIYIFICD